MSSYINIPWLPRYPSLARCAAPHIPHSPPKRAKSERPAYARFFFAQKIVRCHRQRRARRNECLTFPCCFKTIICVFRSASTQHESNRWCQALCISETQAPGFWEKSQASLEHSRQPKPGMLLSPLGNKPKHTPKIDTRKSNTSITTLLRLGFFWCGNYRGISGESFYAIF